MNEWHLSDGTVLTLSSFEKLNVAEHNESLAISVLETSERLSLIKLELEMLLEELDRRV